MKELYKYLTENNIELINEGEELSFLLLDYDSAIEYFNEYKLFSNRKIIEMGLTPDIIKQLYTWYDLYQMPCPIVANYQRKPGKFVFRRWISKFSDDLDIEIYKNFGPYQGLHNTNLKEDGKYFPSAEDYEFVIAYSHNKNNMDMTDPDNIEFVAKKQLESNSKLEQLMVFYSQNEESCKRMSSPLVGIKSELYKLPSVKATTSEWKKLGNFPKDPNKTPKTDIISNDNNYRISVKKSKSGSQLMSGGEHEARATLLSCIDYLKNEKDKNALIELCSLNWKVPTKMHMTASERKKANDKELEDIDNYNKKLTLKLNEIITNPANIDFKRAVMLEAATGEKKFGKNSLASANYIFVWDDLKDYNKLYKIEDYVESKLNSAKFTIGFKTASEIGVALRIAIK